MDLTYSATFVEELIVESYVFNAISWVNSMEAIYGNFIGSTSTK